jgi:hypothetical protein
MRTAVLRQPSLAATFPAADVIDRTGALAHLSKVAVQAVSVIET